MKKEVIFSGEKADTVAYLTIVFSFDEKVDIEEIAKKIRHLDYLEKITFIADSFGVVEREKIQSTVEGNKLIITSRYSSTSEFDREFNRIERDSKNIAEHIEKYIEAIIK